MKIIKSKNLILLVPFLSFLAGKSLALTNGDSLKFTDHHQLIKQIDEPVDYDFDYHKFRLEANFGFATRLGQFSQDLSLNQRYFTETLSYGAIASINGIWFNSKTTGYGIDISRYMSTFKGYNNGILSQAPMDYMTDKLSITYVGPSYTFRQYTFSYQSSFVGSISVGYLVYRENIDVQNTRYVRQGQNFGLKVNMGYEYEWFDKIAVGIKLSFTGGALSKYYVWGNGNVETYYFPDGMKESLYHMELSVGLRYLVPQYYYFK